VSGDRILVFDLDGTLVDTAPDLVTTLNVIVAAIGRPPLAYAAAVMKVGYGARAMLEAALAETGGVPEPPGLDALTDRFIAHYADHIADRSRPFPGTVAALDRFAAQGWRLAVCTNKLEGLARQLLAELGLADRFAAITGPDTFGFRKPDPRHLVETIRLAGGDRDAAVMVGDSHVDVDTAKAAAVPVVAVSFGYSTRPVASLGADRVIDHYDQLAAAVAGLLPSAP
jgi:phosphoglycolate phosphatase